MAAIPATVNREFRHLLEKLVTNVPLMRRMREAFWSDSQGQETSFKAQDCNKFCFITFHG